MIIEAIQSISASNTLKPLEFTNLTSLSETQGSDFSALLATKLETVNQSIETGNTTFERYIKGENVSVHEVMIAMGKAKSELQLVVEVRNKLLEAYQEITRIQV